MLSTYPLLYGWYSHDAQYDSIRPICEQMAIKSQWWICGRNKKTKQNKCNFPSLYLCFCPKKIETGSLLIGLVTDTRSVIFPFGIVRAGTYLDTIVERMSRAAATFQLPLCYFCLQAKLIAYDVHGLRSSRLNVMCIKRVRPMIKLGN